MSSRADLLLEVGCEELPAASILKLARQLAQDLAGQLHQTGLMASADACELFGSPRRLALRLADVADRQPDRSLTRRGPALKAAFDANGQPTPAALGFARSVGLSVDALDRLETAEGSWLTAEVHEAGKRLDELLPALFSAAIGQLAGSRSMRWSDREERFLRPVRWLLALHGDEVIPLEHFGLSAGRRTRGHRIHAPGWHELGSASDYEALLESLHVLPSWSARRSRIEQQIDELAHQTGLEPVLSEALLDEVAGLTEWPVAVMGRFDEDFLQVPDEAIISSLEQHQKCFALRDARGALAPAFIAVANTQSKDPPSMIAGFERVVLPRLADARFFWDKDRQQTLASNRPRLDDILFQKQLGSLGDKVVRLEALSATTAAALGADVEITRRAAHLCKCDLVTDMVGEFPELQGIMGRHYALQDEEPRAVADAIEGHYLPRFSQDALAADAAGRALGLADRLDTVLGIFAAGLKPKGSKDPFALRRAALGIVRILAESGTGQTLRALLEAARRAYAGTLSMEDALLDEVETFIFERLRALAADQELDTNTFNAVAHGQRGSIADFLLRARAVQRFADDPEMASLVAANKRASNLLRQAEVLEPSALRSELLEEPAEQALAAALEAASGQLQQAVDTADYPSALSVLAHLREPVDRFFDEVMVMCEDQALRTNRLSLLAALRERFLQVADVARLGI